MTCDASFSPAGGVGAGSSSAQVFEDQSVLFGRRHGYVYEGPWCAREDIGGGSIQEHCGFNSFEACSRLVLPGNRGFCTQNPAFAGFDQRPTRERKRHRIR